MLRLDKVIKPWKGSAALNDHINLYGFWNETALLTNSGDLGMVLSIPGVDYESLDRSEQEYAVKQLEAVEYKKIIWCGRGDLNPHALRRHPLKMVCLPIPPLPQVLHRAEIAWRRGRAPASESLVILSWTTLAGEMAVRMEWLG